MDVFITSLQFIGSIIGLICLASIASNIERLVGTATTLVEKLDNPPVPDRSAENMILERLAETVGRTYSAPTPPAEPVRRSRKPRA